MTDASAAARTRDHAAGPASVAGSPRCCARAGRRAPPRSRVPPASAWFTAGVDAVGRGTVDVTATGADPAALTGVALLALAAVAAAVAAGRAAARRVLGALVAAAGGWTSA